MATNSRELAGLRPLRWVERVHDPLAEPLVVGGAADEPAGRLGVVEVGPGGLEVGGHGGDGSGPRRTFLAAAEMGVFGLMRLWDTEGARPTLVASYWRESGLPISNNALWDRFVADS